MFLSYIYSQRNRPEIGVKILAQKMTFYTLILKLCDFPTLWKKDCPLCAKEIKWNKNHKNSIAVTNGLRPEQ